MKVLQINSVCGIGSTGRIATDIDNILQSKGHDSYIAYGRDALKPQENFLKIGNKLDFYLHILKTRLFDLHGFGSRNATRGLLRKIDEIDPDIIHLHNIHGYYINIELLFNYLKKIKKPVIWTLHDCWSFTGHCSHFEYEGCECWRIDKNEKCIQKDSYPTSWFLNNSLSNFKRKQELFTGVENLTVVTPSNWLANLARQSLLKEYPVKTINNGINLDIFKPTPSNLKESLAVENKFIILGVAGVWGEKKGLNHFVELSGKVSKDEAIILVGLTDAQIKSLPDNIIGIEKTNSIEELAQLYSMADVFVNPTLEDTFPTTNLEALACGTPVITFQTGGSPETIDEKTGLVIEQENTGKLYEAISKIKNGKLKLDAQDCVDRARKHYNRSDKYQEYVDTYKQIIESKSKLYS